MKNSIIRQIINFFTFFPDFLVFVLAFILAFLGFVLNYPFGGFFLLLSFALILLRFSLVTPHYKNPLFLYPASAILVSSLISYNSNHYTSWVLYLDLIFVILSGSFISYTLIYYWRSLQRSFLSFIRFLIIILQILLFTFACYNLSKGFLQPIFIKDLSFFSQYRYLFFSFLALFICIFYFLNLFYKTELNFYKLFRFLSVREEMYTFLYSWNETIFGPIFSKVIDWLGYSMFNRFCYIISHFIIFYIIRIINLSLFINFTFFHGDLRLLLYLIPLSFFIWFLSFFDYYFQFFLKGCYNHVKLLVQVSLIDDKKTKSFFGIVKTSGSNLRYELTSKALSMGYTYDDLPSLGTEHLMLANIDVILNKYFWFIKILNIALIIGQIINWYFIVYYYFFDYFANLWADSIYITRILHLSKHFSRRQYATEAFRVQKFSQKPLEIESQGSYKVGHPIFVDTAVKNPDNPKEVRYEGQLTHGSGSHNNPSQLLHPTTDLQGNPRPQYFVPPVKSTFIKETALIKPGLPASKQYAEDPIVKANIAKNMPEEENT